LSSEFNVNHITYMFIVQLSQVLDEAQLHKGVMESKHTLKLWSK